MITYKPQLIASLMLLSSLTFAKPVPAQEKLVSIAAAQKINSANELVRQGEFDKAIEEYQQVAPNTVDRDELNYNQAVAQFRKGDIQSAQAMFGEAATSSDTTIAAHSRYNLGNCVYSTALKTAEQDKPAAIEQLREAISHYRDSLRLNGDNADARANIELAGEMIRKLEEEQKQEDQQKQAQQKQDQQKQQNQEQKDQNTDQQNQQSESDKSDSEESESQPDQSQQQSDSQPSDSEASEGSKSKKNQGQKQDQQSPADQPKSGDQSQDQESESNKDQQNQDNKGESEQNKAQDQQTQDQQSADQQSASEQSKDNPKNQSEQVSEEQSEQPSQQTNSSPSQNQQSQSKQQSANEQAVGEPTAEEAAQQNDKPIPSGQLTSDDQQDENGKPNGTVAMVDPNAKNSLMTKEEAMKMLQAVRDRDMLRRLRQEQLERSRHVPVDKDW